MEQMANYPMRWEYHLEYIRTSTNDPQTRDYLTTYYPKRDFPKYAAHAALKRLDELGTQGWELVHMEPVDLGRNGDVRIGGEQVYWTNIYFCVFKRPARRS